MLKQGKILVIEAKNFLLSVTDQLARSSLCRQSVAAWNWLEKCEPFFGISKYLTCILIAFMFDKKHKKNEIPRHFSFISNTKREISMKVRNFRENKEIKKLRWHECFSSASARELSSLTKSSRIQIVNFMCTYARKPQVLYASDFST